MHILVTNDDGIYSKGLLALAQVMRNYGDVSVLAPDRNWSSCGHVKTLSRPLRIYKTELEDGTPAMLSDGSPSDCVAIAAIGAVDGPIDLVVSGVNTSANLGHDVTYSGTVTAAMEAAIHGINGIAFSQEHASNGEVQDYAVSQTVIQQVMDRFLEKKLPAEIFLNVNIPNISKDDLKGIQITRQGTRIYHDELEVRTDPRGGTYYWIAGDMPTGLPDPGTDIGALSEGFASVTPLQLDLTAHDRLKDWSF